VDGGGFRRVPRLFLNECLDFPGSYWINLDAKKARTPMFPGILALTGSYWILR